MSQGKKEQQIEDSNTFAGYAFLALVILCLGLFFAQCFNEMQP